MFGDRLKTLREQQGFTQKDLSNMLGVSAGTVGMWEQGRRTPPVATINKIASLLGVDAAGLIETERELTDEEIDQLGKWAAEDDFADLFMKHYRLDDYGRAAVESLIRNEFQRCAAQNTLFPPNLSITVSLKDSEDGMEG